ncbi:hypothetical protein [Frankia gtarii]|uniref:hypothetical protein n=1 Tax=Frankia gtarii TaxID=2950102 RepID=UPI0021BEDE16|nr:hypothetical protein [Frankia gtarii]
MTDIVTIVASVDEIPTVEETDAMLNELRPLSRDARTIELINDLLELRSLLGAPCRGHASRSRPARTLEPYPEDPDRPANEGAYPEG